MLFTWFLIHVVNITGRVTDYISNERSARTKEIYFSIPAGYDMEHLPERVHHEFQGLKFTQDVKIDNSLICVKQEFINAPVRVTVADFEKLCSFYQKVAASNARMIELKQSKA